MTTEFATLPLAHIASSLTNPRKHFDAGRLAELAESIKASGVHQPILVRPLPGGRVADTDRAVQFEIVCGERRWRASQQAGVDTIPAMVRALTDQQVLEIQIIENLQRDDLAALEEAEGYEALLQHASLTVDQVAEKIGKSRSYVYARLKLIDLTAESRQALRDGLLDASRALLIARIPDHKLQLKALEYATKGDWQGELPSQRKLQDWLKANVMLRLDAAVFKIADASLVKAAGSCTDCPKRTGAAPELFFDVDSADICTDPACFHGKEEAHRAQLIKKATGKGMRVVEGKEALELMDGNQHRQRPHGYTDLATQRPDLTPDGDKPATLAQLLGKDTPAPICFVHPRTQEVMELVPTDEADAILLAKGLVSRKAQAQTVTDLQGEIEFLQKKAQSDTNRAIHSAVYQATAQAIRDTTTTYAMDYLLSTNVLIAWLLTQLDNHDNDTFPEIIGYQFAEGEDESDGITQHIKGLNAYAAIRATALVMLHEDATASYYADNTPLIQQAFAEDLSLNVKAITKDATGKVKADYAEQIKAVKAQLDALTAQKAAQEAKKPPEPTTPLAQPNPARAGGKPPKGSKGKSPAAPVPKLSAEDALSAIAAAMQSDERAQSDAAPEVQQVEQPGLGLLTKGARVQVITDLGKLQTRLHKYAGKQGTVTAKMGDEAWDVTFRGRTGGLASFHHTEIEVLP